MNNDQQKWEYLAGIVQQDAQHPEIRRRAGALWQAAGGDPRIFAQLAAALCRDGIRYIRDTARVGSEDIAGYTRKPKPNDAIDALRRKVDDCDAKARAFVALCLAAGLAARMMPFWRQDPDGPMLQHVYGAVKLGERWCPVELTLARARVGDFPTKVPKEVSGRWLRT
jgi:transglutaminase-like putative cysteine protease